MRDEEITLPQVVESFAGKKIAVIGDLMMDAYIWGTARRISPEAPVSSCPTKYERLLHAHATGKPPDMPSVPRHPGR